VVGYPNDFHDLIVLENGNYLMLANEYRIVDMDTVVEGGQQGVTVIGGVIFILLLATSILSLAIYLCAIEKKAENYFYLLGFSGIYLTAISGNNSPTLKFL